MTEIGYNIIRAVFRAVDSVAFDTIQFCLDTLRNGRASQTFVHTRCSSVKFLSCCQKSNWTADYGGSGMLPENILWVSIDFWTYFYAFITDADPFGGCLILENP